MADEGGSGQILSLRRRFSRLLSRRSSSDDKPGDELQRRHAALKARLGELQEEARAVETERDVVSRELSQLRSDVEATQREAADKVDTDALGTRIEELGSRTQPLKERADALDRRTGELERESEEVYKLLSERNELYRSATIEGEKFYFEVYKLTATLSAASIVAVSAISIAVGQNPVWGWAIYAAYGLLLISLGTSVLACLHTVLVVVGLLAPGIMRSDPRGSWGGKVIALAALVGLIGGIILILNFMAANVTH